MKSKGPRFFFRGSTGMIRISRYTEVSRLHHPCVGAEDQHPGWWSERWAVHNIERWLMARWRFPKKVVIPPWKINMETKAQNGGLEDYFIYFPFHMDIVLGSSR